MPAGLGHYDANGVWIYGEDDLAGPFSDLLNKNALSLGPAVDGMVTDALAESEPLRAAVVTAVGVEVANRDLVEGDDPRIPFLVGDGFEYPWSVTDREGKRAAAILQDGSFAMKPATETLDHISAALAARLLPIGAGVTFLPLPALSGYAYSVEDLDGRSAFAVRLDGTIRGTIDKALNVPATVAVDDAREYIRVETVGVTPNRNIRVHNAKSGAVSTLTAAGDNFDPEVFKEGQVAFRSTVAGLTSWVYIRHNDATKTKYLVDATGDIAFWGDSLTNRQGMVNALRAAMPEINVYEGGAEGQTSAEIFSRQGGNTATADAAFTIPPAGPVTFEITPDVAWHDGNENSGSFRGIPGLLTQNEARLATFTRTDPGDATLVPAGTPWVSAHAIEFRGRTQIFFTGRNNTSANGAATILPLTKAGAAYLTPLTKRFLVLSVTTATNETVGTTGYTTITGVNAQLAAEFAGRYLDIRRYLVDNARALLAARGTVPTAADEVSLAGDTIPPSMMSGDTIHFIDWVQTKLGEFIYKKIQEMGWHA
jgi:hypothetical protein